jgi:hypothetical protein
MTVAQAPAVDRASEIGEESRFLQLCRIGFLGRGLLYILIGLLVFGTGRTEDLTGALDYLDRGFGKLLLVAICAGMIGYGLWRLSDAAFGVEHPGTHKKALVKRVSAGVIGLIYFYLAYKALGILFSTRSGQSDPEQQAEVLLDLPGGWVVLGFVALVLVGVGVYQFRTALKCSFLRRLDQRASGTAVKWLGRVGYASRAIIFVMVGLLIGRAALDGRADKAGGMEQALDLLSGPLLYAVAGGLMLFGLFSIIEGLFRRIHAPSAGDIKRELKKTVAD